MTNDEIDARFIEIGEIARGPEFIRVGDDFQYLHNGHVMGWVEKIPQMRPKMGYHAYAVNELGEKTKIPEGKGLEYFLVAISAKRAVIKYCRDAWMRGWHEQEARKKSN